LFTLIAPIFTFFLQPISAYFQRKFEFEADDFASQHAQASKLVSRRKENTVWFVSR
jgi:STE24 endopeptidase